MNYWTKIALKNEELKDRVDRHEFDAAGAICSDGISGSGGIVSDELIGLHLIRAYCHASFGRVKEALSDHLTALGLIGDEPDGALLFEAANDAVEAGLPPEICAELFARCSVLMQKQCALRSDGSVYPSKTLIASAFNKEGICRYKADDTVENEKRCYIDAISVIDSISQPDEDDAMLGALIRSNLAECCARSGDLIDAAELYKKSCLVYEPRCKESAVCADQYVMCLRSLSDINRAAGDNIAAFGYLTQAIGVLEKHPDGASDSVIEQLSSYYNARGTLRFHVGDYAGEIDDCTSALDIRSHVASDTFSMATIYSNRAEAYEQLQDYEAAAQDYLASIERLELSVNEPEAKAMICFRKYSLAHAYCGQELFREAMEQFSDCAERLRQLRKGEHSGVSEGQINDTEAYCRMWMAQLALDAPFTDYHLALTEGQRAISLFEDSEPTDAIIQRLSFLHFMMSDIYEMFDEHESAAEHMNAAHELLENAAADSGEDEDEDIDSEDDIWDDTSGTIPQA